MTKSNIKKMTIAMLGCCALACFATGGKLVSAETATIDPQLASVSKFAVVDGASLYLYTGENTDTDKDYNGMRFIFEMSVGTYNTLVNEEYLQW